LWKSIAVPCRQITAAALVKPLGIPEKKILLEFDSFVHPGIFTARNIHKEHEIKRGQTNGLHVD
jgi:hypothetical protein